LTRLLYEAEPHFAAMDMVLWRFLTAVACLWLFVGLRGQVRTMLGVGRADKLRSLGLGALFAVAATSSALSLERVPASTYTLLIYTYPAMVAILTSLLGERLLWLRWGAVGLALLGCSLTVTERVAIDDPLDAFFPLFNAFSYALYLVLAERFIRLKGLPASAWSISGTFLTLLPVALLLGFDLPTSPQGAALALGLGSVATFIPILLMFIGIALVGAANAAILSTLEPICVLLLAALILGERLAPIQAVGGALILASVVLLNLPLAASAKAKPAPQIAPPPIQSP
jgi:drug/metabolite transporter (DMT)-like permease